LLGLRRLLRGQRIRLDRNLEHTLTGGDLRYLADLPGPSIAAASTVDRGVPPIVT
jgi:hypothetical protein